MLNIQPLTCPIGCCQPWQREHQDAFDCLTVRVLVQKMEIFACLAKQAKPDLPGPPAAVLFNNWKVIGWVQQDTTNRRQYRMDLYFDQASIEANPFALSLHDWVPPQVAHPCACLNLLMQHACNLLNLA